MAPIIFIFSILLSYCQAGLVNRTIDDTLGDPTTGFRPIYNPVSGHWEDQTCTTCAIRPDPSLAFDETWTAATYHPSVKNISITLEFTGVAIWVFFILANGGQRNITTNTNCNFTLDGHHAGIFQHVPNTETENPIYNATAFSVTGLDNTSHQLIISTSGVPFPVFVNFDYAIYTADLPNGSSTSSPTTVPTQKSNTSPSKAAGTITGATIGSLALLTVVALLFTRFSKSRTKQPLISPLVARTLNRPTQTSSENINMSKLSKPSTPDFDAPTEWSARPDTGMHSPPLTRSSSPGHISYVPYSRSPSPSRLSYVPKSLVPVRGTDFKT